MTKSIVCVGFRLDTDNVSLVNFASKESLIDWDIVLFTPDISSFIYNEIAPNTYQGNDV